MTKIDISFLKEVRHKEGVNKEDWKLVNSNLVDIALFVSAWCEAESLPLTITSIIRPKIPGISVSNTHAEGRAFDISIRGWTQDEIDRIVIDVNNHFKSVGAISIKDGVSRVAVYEDGVAAGKGAHLHFQVRKA